MVNPPKDSYILIPRFGDLYRANDGMKNLKEFFSGISGWALHPIPFSLMREAESFERHT
mgnify:CR=1 FL=1